MNTATEFPVVAADTERPEHDDDRRRFLIWALMIGAVKPERLTERILAEVDVEAAA